MSGDQLMHPTGPDGNRYLPLRIHGPRKRRRRWSDRAVAILFGVGFVVLLVMVFWKDL